MQIFQFLSAKGEPLERRLFWSSVLLLFGEILAIRWLGIEVPTIQAFANLVLLVVLVAASSGMGAPDRYRTPVAYLIGALAVLFGTVIFSVQLNIPKLSVNMDVNPPHIVAISIGLLVLIVICLLVVFVNIGGVMGRCFAGLPPLRAYSINLLGSIFGVLILAAMSFFSLPPPVWILIAGLLCWTIVQNKLVPLLTVLLVCAASTTTLASKWSPYSKLDVIPMEVPADSLLGQGNYCLNSNNKYFHFALRMLGQADEANLRLEPSTRQMDTVKHYYDFLRIPLQCAPKHDRVLVLGGGSGNDVAYALEHGAKHVDVVEIDPIICSLGKTVHPQKPYLDPRVTLHNEDARTFLRYSKDKYDLIQFAYLDPCSTLGTASFVRVDNFVYTKQSIESALKRLDEGGLLTISFATGGQSPVTRRLYQTIAAAQGSPPHTYVDDEWDSVLFLVGPEAAKVKISAGDLKIVHPWPGPNDLTESQPSTDDWPFLYLIYNPLGALTYIGTLLVSVVVPAFLLSRSTKGAISSGQWGNMFFLGQAFMLVETKSITQLSLFFGATWIVSSVVIACVLILAYLANWCAGKLQPEILPRIYVMLGASLLLDYFFQVPATTDISPMLLAIVSVVVGCLPIFFGGMIFSLCFRQAAAPALFLAANLLGVAIGGLAENLCLVTGIKSLVVIAMLMYGMSYVSLLIKAKPSQV
jgi:hypothetical protein